MNIIQINAVYGKGSTGRNVAEMDKEFQARGYGSYIIATRLDEKYENVYEIGNRIEWYFHQGMSLVTGHQGYFSKRSTKKMLNWIKEKKPDIIHINNLRAGAFNFPLLFSFLHENNIPVVLTLHDCFMYTGRCWHYSLKDCYQWETECIRCPSKENCEQSLFFDFSSSLYRDKKKWLTGINKLAVVGVSEWITNEAKKSFLKESYILDTVYNWVDLEIFRPAEKKEIKKLKDKLNIKTEQVVICVASTFNTEKGLNEIRNLAKEIESARFILIGKVDNKNKFTSNVSTLGNIADINLLALYYSMADVMLNPSPEESFGKTTAESLACGTPVVGYACTATSELLNEKTGVLVDYYEKEEGLKRGLMKVFSCGKEYYSTSCREYAIKHFDMIKNIEKYIDIYNRLIQGERE
ncbi:glycosyltransferase [Pseudobutyrivibrio xylanivorans]|uniref:Glycosyltransferase involved in cell wall bisynthesis n=1 Tax=Pseudobutyrivibrio xylanivorans TaxID=185007 RepID=A0A1G5S5S2_PSEXY|nr:glycosyltransferase [Pseudobutyrivibrio xylanivorans]SCZ81230.1 Glycosyltransferase involved in cell wall bisynthesis [Pseudobutyrivibrio xylanivorans]